MPISILPADAEQIRRARVLIDASHNVDADTKFIFLVGALYLARSIPEHWYMIADEISIELYTGEERSDIAKRLRTEFEGVFKTARRYALITDLRQWDYHWEPNAINLARKLRDWRELITLA